jgi:D-beta-D-heptose 7-phosphate kinase/D-beta-D-heptose 1-phosphate adenosyltransferase
VAKPRTLRSKIKSATALRRIVAEARRKGKRAVFTNGCFDIIHKGHVTYLEQARKQGDLLIVAINDDESVRRIKGPERPINILADRMEVIAALESVDYVTWFEEDTPIEAIKKIRPMVLVKGADWKLENTVGAPEVMSWGGKVRFIRYVEGRSTTKIIERARQRRS